MKDIDKILKTFEARGFKALYFDSPEKAVAFLSSEIKGTEVGMGGSVTIKELSLFEKLSESNKVHWHFLDGTRDEIPAANASPVYITSANAVSKTGEIVNIDGFGNRIQATSCGAGKRVYFVVGTNKITDSLNDAIFRAKNIAAPLNAKRLNRKTPCAAKADKCYDCNSPERICRITSIMTRPPLSMEVTLVVIDGKFGY